MVFSGDIDKYNAVSIVQKIVAKLGGKGGGGKADLAQGGAPDTSNISALTLDEIF